MPIFHKSNYDNNKIKNSTKWNFHPWDVVPSYLDNGLWSWIRKKNNENICNKLILIHELNCLEQMVFKFQAAIPTVKTIFLYTCVSLYLEWPSLTGITINSCVTIFWPQCQVTVRLIICVCYNSYFHFFCEN